MPFDCIHISARVLIRTGHPGLHRRGAETRREPRGKTKNKYFTAKGANRRKGRAPHVFKRLFFLFLRVGSVLCGEIFVFGFPAVLCASLRLCGGFSRKGKSVP